MTRKMEGLDSSVFSLNATTRNHDLIVFTHNDTCIFVPPRRIALEGVIT